MDKPRKLELVRAYSGRALEIDLIAGDTSDYPPHVVDALYDAVSLSDLTQGEQDSDPYGALAEDGIDAYTGLDTVLNGTHDHCLMMVGFAMMEVDDES